MLTGTAAAKRSGAFIAVSQVPKPPIEMPVMYTRLGSTCTALLAARMLGRDRPQRASAGATRQVQIAAHACFVTNPQQRQKTGGGTTFNKIIRLHAFAALHRRWLNGGNPWCNNHPIYIHHS